MRCFSRTGKYWALLLLLLVGGLQGCVGEIKENTASDSTGTDTKTEDLTGDGTLNPGDVTADSHRDLDDDVTVAPDVSPDVTPDAVPDVIPDSTQDLEADVAPVPFCEGTVGSIPLDQLVPVYMETMCGFWARCGETIPLDFGATRLTIAECMDNFPGVFKGATLDGVNRGFIEYDPVRAASCVRGLCSMTCSGIDSESTDCKLTFVGKVQEGQNCYVDEECEPGTNCNACGGTCVRNGCSDGCGVGLACDYTAQTCVPISKQGEDCGATQTCEPQLFCKSEFVNNTNVYTCRARLALNQPCTYSGECVTTAYCDTNSSPQVCRARMGANSACDSNDQCLDNLVCAVTNPTGYQQCLVKRWGLPAATPCNPKADTCAWPNLCVPDGASFKCGDRLLSGSPCVDDNHCFGYCNDNMSCENKKADGTICRSDSECQLFCSQDQKCVSTLSPLDGYCKRDYHCEAGECSNNQCVPTCLRPI